MNRRFILPIFSVLLFCFAPVASAHAILLSATPGPGTTVTGPETSVLLRFNSRIDARRSLLMLVTPTGEVQKLVIGEQSSPESLSSKLTQLKTGSYTLRWQVLAVDGHITRGEVPFRVH